MGEPHGVTRVLFVCLGNICRSPMAEGVFRHLARERGVASRFHAESAGTGAWHVGELPDPRARATARHYGIELTSRAQVFDAAKHLGAFDWFVPMDRSNEARLLKLGTPRERTRLLRSFDPALAHSAAAAVEKSLEVPDPYTGTDGMFHEVYEMIRAGCEGMLAEI